MRRLHPVNRGDREVDRGRYECQDGRSEVFTVNLAEDGRRTVHVEVLPSGALWQLTLSPEGLPERIEALWREGEQTFEVALTCFEDEVLFWRRGAEPISEALVMPPGYRLLWPPVAGRDVCLQGLEAGLDDQGRAAVMFLSLVTRPVARGGLLGRPVKLTLRGDVPVVAEATILVDPTNETEVGPGIARAIALDSPGLPAMQAELDAHGRLVRWLEDGEIIAERELAIASPVLPQKTQGPS